MAKLLTHADLTVACLSFLARGEVAASNADILARARLVHDMVGEVDTDPADIVGEYTVDGVRRLVRRDGAEVAA